MHVYWSISVDIWHINAYEKDYFCLIHDMLFPIAWCLYLWSYLFLTFKAGIYQGKMDGTVYPRKPRLLAKRYDFISFLSFHVYTHLVIIYPFSALCFYEWLSIHPWVCIITWYSFVLTHFVRLWHDCLVLQNVNLSLSLEICSLSVNYSVSTHFELQS